MESKKICVKAVEVDQHAWEYELWNYQYSLFNTVEWVLSTKLENNSALFINFYSGDEISGKICGIDFQEPGEKDRMIYFYGGPALKTWDPGLFKECLEALRLMAINKGYSRVMIRPFDQLTVNPVKARGYFSTRNIEMVVFYEEYKQGLRFSYGFKQNKKKAIKAGAVYKTSQSPEMVPHLLRLMGNTLDKRDKKYGVRYNPFYLMNVNAETLYKLVDSGLARFHYAEVNGEIHCVQFNLEKGDRIYALLMGATDLAYSIGIPSLIDFTVSTQAMESGKFSYNLGSLPRNNEGGMGIKKYKESAGARVYVEFGYYSYFLRWPKKIYNPLIRLSKLLPNNNILDAVRKFISRYSIGGPR